MKVLSRHSTNVGYGSSTASSHQPLVHLRPGLNRVSAAAVEILRKDPAFVKDMKAGLVEFIADPLPTAAVPEPSPAVASNLSPEEQAAENARILAASRGATVDPDDDENAKLVADFFAMKKKDREAYYGALNDAQKAAIDAARKA